ncbi:hypothetical protein H0H93_008024, partial [Arthromyces matolae]
MVNPGSFKGLRKAFLTSRKSEYSLAVAENRVSDTLANIQRAFFKRFPLELDQEPSQQEVDSVDDSAADPEPVIPDPDLLSEQEYEEAMTLFTRRQQLITFRKAQIKRWFHYQHWKDRLKAAEDPEVQVAFRSLLHCLTGQGFRKPKRNTPSNHWAALPDNRTRVDNLVRERSAFVGPKDRAGLRTKVVSEVFKTLPIAEQKEWEDVSRADHAVAMKEWERLTKGEPSSTPADIQTYIEAAVPFMQNVIDMVTRLTGMKGTFLLGGPEPADGGRLNVISIHSGHTSGNVKMNFGVSEREAYQHHILPIFGKFLKKCYTMDECRARAIGSSAASLASVIEDHGQGANFISFGDLSPPAPPIVEAVSHISSTSSLPGPSPPTPSSSPSTTPKSSPGAFRRLPSVFLDDNRPCRRSPGPSPPPSPQSSPGQSPSNVPLFLPGSSPLRRSASPVSTPFHLPPSTAISPSPFLTSPAIPPLSVVEGRKRLRESTPQTPSKRPQEKRRKTNQPPNSPKPGPRRVSKRTTASSNRSSRPRATVSNQPPISPPSAPSSPAPSSNPIIIQPESPSSSPSSPPPRWFNSAVGLFSSLDNADWQTFLKIW